jgi:hypothetical protein
MSNNTNGNNGTSFNEIATQLADRVKEWVRKGSERRITVEDKNGRTWVNTTLTTFAVIGFVLLVIFDWFAVIVALIAAFVLKPTFKVVRLIRSDQPESDESEKSNKKVNIKVEHV